MTFEPPEEARRQSERVCPRQSQRGYVLSSVTGRCLHALTGRETDRVSERGDRGEERAARPSSVR